MQSCQSVCGPPCCGSLQHALRQLSHLLFILLLYSITCSNGITSQTKKESAVPLLGAIPETPFRCLGHSAGYYADPDTGCQVYHMCDTLERQYSYLCPNYTLFNQKFMVCDHWYMVDCSTSHTFYHLNGHIGEVSEKSEREEEQNTITIRPEEDATTKTSRPSSLSSSTIPSIRQSSNISSGNPYDNPTKNESIFEQPRAQPESTGTNEPLTKLDSPITFAVTPSIINRTSSSLRRNPTSLTVGSTALTSITVTESTSLPIKSQTLLPTQQSSTQFREEPTLPTKQPFDLTRTTFTQSQRLSTISSRSPFTPHTTQSFIPTTGKPFTSPVVSFVEVPTPPTSFPTIPKTKFKNPKNPVTSAQSEIPFFSATRNVTLPDFTNTQLPEEDNSTHTEQQQKGLNMMPGSVARSPGNKFSFTNHKEKEPILTPEDLQRIIFQPLLERPFTKTRRILTSAPSLLPIDPSNSSDQQHHLLIEFHSSAIPEDSQSRDSFDLKLSNSQGIQTPSHIFQAPSESSVLHPPSAFLSPPTNPFTQLRSMKQEFPTLLQTPPETDNLRTSSRNTFLPGARRLPFPLSSQGNRDFFIPSAEFSLLISELPQNNIEDQISHLNHRKSTHQEDHHGSHMTMVFPAPIEPSRMEELKLNPECPRCHPEFLKPGQCHPCVVIK